MINKKNYEVKQIKINKQISNCQIGDIVSISVDRDGTPIERYWRDRVKDSAMDNCVEFVKKARSTSKKKTMETK